MNAKPNHGVMIAICVTFRVFLVLEYPECDTNYDHNPVVATMRSKLKKILQPKPIPIITWASADYNKKDLYGRKSTNS